MTNPKESALEEGSPARAEQHDVEEAILEGEIEDKVKKYGGITRMMFTGPLPPPVLLRQYKDIQSDFPERILQLTEAEAEHRRDITRKTVRLEAIEVILGQVFALVVALAAFIAAGYLGYLGHPAAAALLGTGTIAGLVTAFIRGRSMERNEESEE